MNGVSYLFYDLLRLNRRRVPTQQTTDRPRHDVHGREVCRDSEPEKSGCGEVEGQLGEDEFLRMGVENEHEPRPPNRRLGVSFQLSRRVGKPTSFTPRTFAFAVHNASESLLGSRYSHDEVYPSTAQLNRATYRPPRSTLNRPHTIFPLSYISLKHTNGHVDCTMHRETRTNGMK